MSYNFQKFKDEAKEAEKWLAGEFSQIHTGRAAPAILDGVSIEVYGSKMPLSHVASISVEDPRTLRVSPWDKSQVKEIERAVAAANLGLGTAVDESGLRITFPPLTTERREGLVKVVRGNMEDARIRVRAKREEVWNDIQEKEKTGVLTEDDKFRCKDELQKFTDEANKKLEELAERKEGELMS